MSCHALSSAQLQPPRATQGVHREDCTQCFDGIDDPEGLNVCLTCFNGGCVGQRNHALHHWRLSQHPLGLNIKRTKKPKVERHEPPQKMSKLAFQAELESDKYDTKTSVVCYECGSEVDSGAGKLPVVIDAVMKAMTFATQTEVQAWEQEMTPCEHTLCLEQDASKRLEPQSLATCFSCDLKENLWLCLQCGNLGCGRSQFGNVGGSSHGLGHFEASRHPVSVKLGSITPEGTADVYCYACDEERTDPELAQHLSHWGINIAERQKTEKSLTEMQIEQNLKWDFSMTTEDGKGLKPLMGEGLTGLRNLGNSCYMASILQCLFALPAFQDRYYGAPEGLPEKLNPAEDLETQLRKLSDGLLSGRYSRPDDDVTSSEYSPEVPYQKGLAPSILKALIGKGHQEFSTMRQQDASEFLIHLFKLISRSHSSEENDPVRHFRFVLEQRLQCLGCKGVRYRTDVQDNISVPLPVQRIAGKSQDIEMQQGEAEEGKDKDVFEPVTIKECLDIFTADEVVGFNCPSCGKDSKAAKRHSFKTFPEVLAVNAGRFKYINWVPTKLDVPVVVGDEPFLLDDYLSRTPPANENLLPEQEEPAFQPKGDAMEQLQAMGFSRVRAEKALFNTGNSDAEQAMNWLFGHMEDPDIDTPISLTAKKSSPAEPTNEQISTLSAMGFTHAQSKKALKETDGEVERAVEWLFSHLDDMGDEGEDVAEASTGLNSQAPKKIPGRSDTPAEFELHSIVCHKGRSIHTGHYVAFIRKEVTGEGKIWVLFNDEKVVKAADVEEMKKFAYVYFFKRSN